MNDVKRYFDSTAQNYTRQSRGWVWNWLRKIEADILSEVIGHGFLGDVLDLGCGAGYYSRRMKAQGCRRLVCVDFSEQMLEQCDIPDCEKVRADIQDYVSEEKYDLIFCAGALEFLDRPEKIFTNAAKMLRANGKVVLLLPRMSFLGQIYRLFHKMHSLDIRLFKLDELQKWGRESGLNIETNRIIPLFSLVVRLSASD